MTPRIGELFAGYGGLGMGVQSVIGGEVVWFSEFDAAPSKILAHHFPGVPNHGDITKIDWSAVEPVDVLTGGFPCQDVSLAGARKGLMEGTRSGLWSEFAKAIDALRPGLVVIENVRGLLSAKTVEEVNEEAGDMEPKSGGVGELGRGDRPILNAFGRVLGDLAELGYDAEWCGLRAADAGAPHGRFRVFILAHPANDGHEWSRSARDGRDGLADDRKPAADTDSPGREQHGRPLAIRPELTPAECAGSDVAADARGEPGGTQSSEWGESSGASCAGPASVPGPAGQVRNARFDWGIYAPAIERWESLMGRAAPPATHLGTKGQPRLSPEFVEFLMGLPLGHVTNPAIGLTRNEQLKALGNGVVPQQAALAVRTLTERTA